MAAVLAAQRVSRCKFGGAAALGSPFGRAGERSASLRGCAQLQIWEKCGDCCLCTLSVMTITRYRPAVWAYCQGHSLKLPAGAYPPSQSRLSAVPALPKGEPRGGRCPPGCFPMGKTTSAHCADNGSIKHLQTKFGGNMWKHGILTTSVPGTANTVQPKNLLRWRAANSRPYERPEISAQVIRRHRLRGAPPLQSLRHRA